MLYLIFDIKDNNDRKLLGRQSRWFCVVWFHSIYYKITLATKFVLNNMKSVEKVMDNELLSEPFSSTILKPVDKVELSDKPFSSLVEKLEFSLGKIVEK